MSQRMSDSEVWETESRSCLLGDLGLLTGHPLWSPILSSVNGQMSIHCTLLSRSGFLWPCKALCTSGELGAQGWRERVDEQYRLVY